MDIKTRFNIGDKVSVLDTETQKIKTVTIGSISVMVSKDGHVSVSYYPLDERGEIGYYTTYKESVCYGSARELIDYISG